MSERPESASVDGRTAGQLLRQARLAAGIDIAALAGLIKVPVAKIEAIEADRHDGLPGAAFTRGLAQALCRALKVDPEPILARLPRAEGDRLEGVNRGLNTPFRADRALSWDLSLLRRPIVWGPLLFLALAVAVWLMPVAPFGQGGNDRWPSWPAGSGSPASSVTPATTADGPGGLAVPPPAPPASAASVAGFAPVSTTSIEVVHSAPPVVVPASEPDSLQSRPLVLRAGASSWVEVRDVRGAVLLSRTLQPGETVGVTGQLPFQAIVGNAAETMVTVHGRALDIATFTRDNVARFEVR
jgi:cytoskeleton protein RodZ